MTNLTLADKLLSSCESLFRQNILSKAQYHSCIQNIAGSDTRRQIKVTEENLFSSSRSKKEGKYNEFIKSVEDVMNETFKKYEMSTTTDSEKREYERVLVQLTVLMNNIIDWIQDVSLKRYSVKESSDYESLLFYYNKIDTNRKEIDTVEKQILTLKERDLTQNEKKELRKRDYKSSRNVTIALVVFNIITIVIIFLFYFI